MVPNFDNCAKPFLTLVGEIQMYNTQSLPGSFGDRSPGIDGNRIGRYRLGNGIEAVGIDSVSVGNKIVQNRKRGRNSLFLSFSFFCGERSC